MTNELKRTKILMAMLVIQVAAFSQPTISGPSCAMPGVVYHYMIKGTWKATSTMQVCITGGIFSTKDTTIGTCTQKNGAPLNSVLVIWKSPGAAILTLSSALGNSSFNVTVAASLQPGTIDSSSKKQVIGYDSLPATIICSADSGGSCSPSYKDQWQQSPDAINWKDIPGASSKNLSITTPLKQASFFRRKVTETVSGTIGYSDAAFVDVGPPPPSVVKSFFQYRSDIYNSETAFNNKDNSFKRF